jgi:adenylyltransferase/sulfurtransferase
MIVPSIAGGAVIESEVGQELPELSNEEIMRYSRHLIMPEVGMQGQRRMKAASVLMIGTGGLGAPVGMYLAAAGIGPHRHRRFRRRRGVEPSTADHSRHEDLGRRKIESARDSSAGHQSAHRDRDARVALTSHNAMQLFRNYDVIVDGTDNFPDAISRQRRVRAERKAERLRIDLQV